jgi:hypothetical protein
MWLLFECWCTRAELLFNRSCAYSAKQPLLSLKRKHRFQTLEWPGIYQNVVMQDPKPSTTVLAGASCTITIMQFQVTSVQVLTCCIGVNYAVSVVSV